MMLSLNALPVMIAASLRDPRAFAEGLSLSDMPRQARWELLLLFVIIGTVLTQLNVYLAVQASGGAADPMQQVMERVILERPLIHALLQFSVLTITVFMVYWVGQAAGGTGSFETAILAVAWIELVVSAMRVAQAALWLLSPPLANIFTVLVMVAFFYLLTQFVTAIHGFASPLLVLFGILATGVGVLFGISMLTGLLGLSAGVM